MEFLSFSEYENSMIFRNKNEAQVVRLFFNVCNKTIINSGKCKYKKLISINRLYVVPEYRKQGWAKLIMQQLFYKFPNYTFLINAYPDDEEYMPSNVLIDFYKKFGFEYLKKSENGIIMIKK